MPLTKDTVATWLAAYVRAWETYDPDTIGDLFTEDATYSYHPFEEPVRSRLAIGRSRYFKDASKAELVREYDNLFLIRFDDRGKCRSIREWFMGRRGQPPA